MAIPTSRTHEKAEITLYPDRCKGCGMCVSVCKDFSIEMYEGKVRLADTSVFGCIACGHCMAACRNMAIEISGRFLGKQDLFDLPAPSETADYVSLLNLMKRRRSIREFTDEPVETDLINKIIDAARFAPMGLPPSDVHLLIFDQKEKVRAFAQDYCRFLKSYRWFTSNWFLGLMKPFWGKENDALFRNFVRPVFKLYTQSMDKGVNLVNYDAPACIYFYGSPYADPADPIIAATYAMLTAESLGLGSCMLGAIHPMMQYGRSGKKFREKHGIKFKSREGIFLILGHPGISYAKSINRSFAEVKNYN